MMKIKKYTKEKQNNKGFEKKILQKNNWYLRDFSKTGKQNMQISFFKHMELAKFFPNPFQDF